MSLHVHTVAFLLMVSIFFNLNKLFSDFLTLSLFYSFIVSSYATSFPQLIKIYGENLKKSGKFYKFGLENLQKSKKLKVLKTL